MNTVLVVEDDIDINKALCFRLKSAGYNVISAVDCVQGMSLAVHKRPDVLVIDISMPGGDGFSIIERLRKNTDVGDVPFVVLTASRRPEYRERASELGAHGFLEKPYESGDLLDAVEGAIASGRALT